MSYRPRFLAAFVVLLGLPSGCSLEVDLRGSGFTCADGRCPTGMECNLDEICVRPGGDDLDAASPDDGDADPPDPVIDAGVVDADLDEPAIDAGQAVPCIGDKVVTDPATGHCFRLVEASATFAEATLTCQTLGGQLAIIQSAEENAVVQSLEVGTISTAWIGGSDQATEGDWRWVDGSAFSFTSWNAGEPNDYGSGEDCAVLRFNLEGRWDDRACTSTLFSICELE